MGDWWSILILRDALGGLKRFDEFEESLGIAPNILSRRLAQLVEAGLLERVPYSARPPRHQYVPTECGKDFRPVLVALLTWGNRHFAPEGASVVVVRRETGDNADPILIDRVSGLPVTDADFRLGAGPAAGLRIRRRYAA